MTLHDSSGLDQYIVLPSQGVEAREKEERNFFRQLHLTQSTEPTQSVLLDWETDRSSWQGLSVTPTAALEDVPFQAPAIPLRVVDTVHADGPKLVEASESAALKLRLAAPFVRLVPNRDYAPELVSDSLPLSPPPGWAGAPLTTVEVRGIPANIPVEGTEVLAVTDVARKFGDRGITDQQGRVALQLGPSPVRVDELRVEPPSHGYWGAFQTSVTLLSPVTITLASISLSSVDALRYFYGTTPKGLDGMHVRVAVIDTGIDLAHPDLRIQRGANTVTGEPSTDYGDNGIGHGTHVAGIVAATGVPPHGVRGLAPDAELVSYRVYGANSSTAKTYAIMKALIYAVRAGCHLINLSLGATPPDEALKDAIVDAGEQGAVVIGAAGNGRRQAVSVPACYATAVSALGRTGTFPAGAREEGDVAAPAGADPADFVAAFSNVGPDIDFIAPGVGIVSTVPGGYAPGRGTSMAAAAATGMAARLLSARSDLLQMSPASARSAAVRNYLGNEARSMGFGLTYEGYGML